MSWVMVMVVEAEVARQDGKASDTSKLRMIYASIAHQSLLPYVFTHLLYRATACCRSAGQGEDDTPRETKKVEGYSAMKCNVAVTLSMTIESSIRHPSGMIRRGKPRIVHSKSISSSLYQGMIAEMIYHSATRWDPWH